MSKAYAERYVDPKIDLAFKILFSREATMSLLICLLNAILDLPEGRRIVELVLFNSFNPQETMIFKKASKASVKLKHYRKKSVTTTASPGRSKTPCRRRGVSCNRVGIRPSSNCRFLGG